MTTQEAHRREGERRSSLGGDYRPDQEPERRLPPPLLSGDRYVPGEPQQSVSVYDRESVREHRDSSYPARDSREYRDHPPREYDHRGRQPADYDDRRQPDYRANDSRRAAEFDNPAASVYERPPPQRHEPPLASGGDRYYPAAERDRDPRERDREHPRYVRTDDRDPHYRDSRPRSYSDTRSTSPGAPPPLDSRLGPAPDIRPNDHSGRPARLDHRTDPRRDDRPPPVQSEVALRALAKREQAAASNASKPLEERIGSRPPPATGASLQERLAALPAPSSNPDPNEGDAPSADLGADSDILMKTEPEDDPKIADLAPPTTTSSTSSPTKAPSSTSSPSKATHTAVSPEPNSSLEARLSAPADRRSVSRPPHEEYRRPQQDPNRERENGSRTRVPPPGTGDRYVPPYDGRDAYRANYRPGVDYERDVNARVLYEEQDRNYTRDRDYTPRDRATDRDYISRDEVRPASREPSAARGDARGETRTSAHHPRFREDREPPPDWQYDYDR